jgi:hypothetical protein
MTPREKHVFVTQFLLSGRSIGELVAAHQIEEAQAVIEYVRAGPPTDLAMTDPALFKGLRDSITKHMLAGWHLVPLE